MNSTENLSRYVNETISTNELVIDDQSLFELNSTVSNVTKNDPAKENSSTITVR